MAVTVLIPTPLRKFTNDQETVQVDADTIGALITALDTHFPGIAARLTDEQGALRKFINVYVNEEDIRFLQGKETTLKDGDTVSIVPAIAGG
ncbi:MAG: MoaD/ThiS family protein [Chloroherpetonaceae bacterium]|nr:MoaD/ThiS family protein [Chthonomonadaceae bacterium]MDW8209018.1 MoaD/ThiS family protein [Chloroherpetonaceae bacterium]